MANIQQMTVAYNPTATVTVNAQGIDVQYGTTTHRYGHGDRRFTATFLPESKAEIALTATSQVAFFLQTFFIGLSSIMMEMDSWPMPMPD